ncbi:N-lysine methyltransferase SMYD2-like isoform X2 [Paramacrobiotus metropolitanus]|uniref:N-lysine methyltransferase SMYD2-like isoform X2 n=1 Tax=Paramacrobiotus metropolitanus TaxID=2943436 RepID=UPI0024465BB4|nr:N-lysine methyltransferase SMYD2-like isoform X2 [Paramacrobiotus metropolitanus]
MDNAGKDSDRAGTRSFNAGDLIISCEPWVWCLHWNSYPKVCAYCWSEPKELYTCSGCKLHRYCDIECQAADWKQEHKAECDILKCVADELALLHVHDPDTDTTGVDDFGMMSGSTSSILTQKIARKARLNIMEEIPGHGKLSVEDILNLFPKLNQHDAVNRRFQRCHPYLYQALSAQSPSPSIPDMAECVTIVHCNAFPILKPGRKSRIIGTGLFPAVPHGLMIPVCWDSNVTMDFKKRRLFIHATEDIPVYTGLHDLRYCEMPFNVFTKSRNHRRAQFEEFYGRPCTCCKCTPEYGHLSTIWLLAGTRLTAGGNTFNRHWTESSLCEIYRRKFICDQHFSGILSDGLRHGSRSN